MVCRELVLMLLVCGVLAANGSSTELFSLRLVGGRGRCQGQLQVQRAGQDWTEVSPWFSVSLWFGQRLCAELDCGPALSVEDRRVPSRAAVVLYPDICDDTSLINCFTSDPYNLEETSLELSCSDSMRLDGKKRVCSGSLQSRGQSWDQSWTGVCEGALDHHGAEVVCRELGCGPPVLQGALSPVGQMFHCEGHESALMDCPRTKTHPEICPALTLSCSELRLVGGSSRCEGTVEVNYRGEWRPMSDYRYIDYWSLEDAAAVCRDLDCGSAVFTEKREGFNFRAVWDVHMNCVQKYKAVRDCVTGSDIGDKDRGLVVVCSVSSELLHVPEVSVSEGVWAPRAEGGVWAPRADEGDWTPVTGGGVWVQMDADFQITCSVKTPYPNGFFLLISPTANLTAPAVNHSAHFLFTDAGSAHRGNYTCVYLLKLLNHNLSSNATLHVYPGESDSKFLVRTVILLLLQLLNFIPYFFYRQATRGQQRAGRAGRRRAREEEHTDVVFDVVVPSAEYENTKFRACDTNDLLSNESESGV